MNSLFCYTWKKNYFLQHLYTKMLTTMFVVSPRETILYHNFFAIGSNMSSCISALGTINPNEWPILRDLPTNIKAKAMLVAIATYKVYEEDQPHAFIYCADNTTHYVGSSTKFGESKCTHSVSSTIFAPTWLNLLISSGKRWPQFRSLYFRMHFRESNVLYFDHNFTELCS